MIIRMLIHPHGWWVVGDIGIIIAFLALVDLIFGANAMNAAADFLADLEWDFGWFDDWFS
jgi:hypothetical protein